MAHYSLRFSKCQLLLRLQSELWYKTKEYDILSWNTYKKLLVSPWYLAHLEKQLTELTVPLDYRSDTNTKWKKEWFRFNPLWIEIAKMAASYEEKVTYLDLSSK